MKVKDVVVSFDNLYGVDYHVIADFYDEDGFTSERSIGVIREVGYLYQTN